MNALYGQLPLSSAYEHVQRKLERGECVLLDGGVATELQRLPASEKEPWGVWALHSAQAEVDAVHRRYVAAGCDVLSTNSWSILEEAEHWTDATPPRAWADAADAALRLAREAVSGAARSDECAVAFCINGGLRGERALGALELLSWRWRMEPPDLVVFETLEELPGQRVLDAVALVAELGLPVWVSLRRGAHGPVSVEGTPAGGESAADLAAAMRGLERNGASAVLVNCVPPELIPGALGALKDATSLPIGCYPNIGRPGASGWEPRQPHAGDELTESVLDWIEGGAQIVGGCCGSGPQHIRELRRVLERTAAWSARGV